MRRTHQLIVTLIIFTIALKLTLQTCNENACGSVISKCLLMESCSCKSENKTCLRHCFTCLGPQFDECCSCINICPNQTDKTWTDLSKTSSVADFEEKLPLLFTALTEMPDPLERWVTLTFPVEIDSSLFAPKLDINLQVQSRDLPDEDKENYESNKNVTETYPNLSERNIEVINCTVVFLGSCGSLDKCKNTCKSMGASKMRWFHDGCCQCVGDTCINYGINESRCKCVEDLEEDPAAMNDEDFTLDELDFGEDDVFEEETEGEDLKEADSEMTDDELEYQERVKRVAARQDIDYPEDEGELVNM